MTNKEKAQLKHLVQQGYSNKVIKEEMDCCNSTIYKYRKVFGKTKKETA